MPRDRRRPRPPDRADRARARPGRATRCGPRVRAPRRGRQRCDSRRPLSSSHSRSWRAERTVPGEELTLRLKIRRATIEKIRRDDPSHVRVITRHQPRIPQRNAGASTCAHLAPAQDEARSCEFGPSRRSLRPSGAGAPPLAIASDGGSAPRLRDLGGAPPAHRAADFAVARPPLAQPRQRPLQERQAGVVAAAHGVAA